MRKATLREGFYWRGNIIWTRLPDEGRVSTGCKDPEAAYLWRADHERRRADPTYSAARETTLRAAVTSFVSELKTAQRRPHTLSFYRTKLGHALRVIGEDTPLVEIDARVIQSFLKTRLEEDGGASPRTVKKELAALQSMLKAARHRGEFVTDPKLLMPLRFNAPYEPRRRFLTRPEVPKLLAELLPHHAAWVCLALACAGRLSEVNGLRHADVSETTIRIRGTKTKGSDKEIPILAIARPFLERALRDGTGTNGRIVHTWMSSNASRDLRAACTRAGIEPVSPNDLRRTVASWLVQGGVPTNLVAFMLRHTSSQMVERVYGRQTAETVGSLVQKLIGECDGSVPTTRKKKHSAAKKRTKNSGVSRKQRRVRK